MKSSFVAPSVNRIKKDLSPTTAPPDVYCQVSIGVSMLVSGENLKMRPVASFWMYTLTPSLDALDPVANVSVDVP